MRLILATTERALVYQQDNGHPCAMYGVAAELGVEFDDELHTTVRAFHTADPGVNCIGVHQGGEHQDFWVPVGTLVILEDGQSLELPGAYTVEPAACGEGYRVRREGRLARQDGKPILFTTLGAASQYIQRCVAREKVQPARVYQHSLGFGTSAQTKAAAATLAQINLMATNVKTRTRCHSLSFQTAYAFGPIMRGVLSQELQSESALFNRQPHSFEKLPVLRRVTPGQVVIVLIVFALCCGPASLRCDWVTALLGLCFTIPTAWVSSDILGLVESCRVHEGQVVR